MDADADAGEDVSFRKTVDVDVRNYADVLRMRMRMQITNTSIVQTWG